MQTAAPIPVKRGRGCLLDKRKRDEMNAKLKGVTTKELRARIQERLRDVQKKD